MRIQREDRRLISHDLEVAIERAMITAGLIVLAALTALHAYILWGAI